MEISGIMATSRNLINLCAIRQKIRIKNTFAYIVYNFLVAKQSWKNIKKFV